MKLTFFTKEDCELCDAAWFVLRRVADGYDIEIEKVDITTPGAEQWFDLYKHDIPVIHLNGKEVFRHRVDEKVLRRMLQAAPPLP